MKEFFAIYALMDLRAGDVSPEGKAPPEAIFYVGQTGHIGSRRLRHLEAARRNERQTPVTVYIREMLAGGDEPKMLVLQCGEGDSAERKQAEDEWMAFFRRLGSPLVNAQEGGQSGYHHSPETRQRMGEGIRRAKSDPEQKTRQSEAAKRVWKDPEKRERCLAALREKGAQRAGFPSAQAFAERDAEIFALWEAGVSRAEISERFGIPRRDISNVVTRARRRAKEQA